MLATHVTLHNPQPRADHPLTADVKRVGDYAVVVTDNTVYTTIDGRLQYFSCFELAEEFINLYSQGNQDRAVPVIYLGMSVVIKGSLVCRADAWVQDAAPDLGIGEWAYVWYFTFSHSNKETSFILAEEREQAVIEFVELAKAEMVGDEDLSKLPF